MRHLISIVFCFLSVTLFGQLNDADAFVNGTYDKNYALVHKIKQVNVTNYIDSNKSSYFIFDFDNKGFLKKQTILDRTLKKVSEYTYIYYKKGDQIERINVDYELNTIDTVKINRTYDGLLLIQEKSSELPFLTKHFYNESNKKVQSISFLSNDTTHSLKRVSYYSYDTNGKLKTVQESYIEANNTNPIKLGTTEFIYDELGSIIVVKRPGKPNYNISYDQQGFLKSKTVKMNEDLGGLTIEENYSYIFWK